MRIFLALMLAASSAAADVLALYEFNETGSVIIDTSGNAFDLEIATPDLVSRIDSGIVVASGAIIHSAAAGAAIKSAIQQNGTLTVEMTITPENDTQGGPSRIFAVSQNGYPDGGNIVIGQQALRYVARFRTASSDQYGKPELSTGGIVALDETLLTFEYANGSRKIYIDGVLAADDTVNSDLSTWGDFQLTLANEPDGGRPWAGVFHQVKISTSEALPPPEPPPVDPPAPISKSPPMGVPAVFGVRFQ